VSAWTEKSASFASVRVSCEQHVPRPYVAYLPVLGYIGTIFAANWAISTFGVVPVGFGLVAPAGVYFAGLAFTLRDLTQEALGRRWTIAAIIVGAALSGLVSAQFALASGVAFLVSELADYLVYTPLRERNWPVAVGASNLVGLVLDSVLFLSLAFGSLDFLWGQIVGKLWMTLLAVLVIAGLRRQNAWPRPAASRTA
jgi:queuosine precursor transporter